MMKLRRLIAVMIAAGIAPASLQAQEAATITGRVTNAQGQPEAAVLVRIESLNVGATTGADGNYRLVVPAARVRAGQAVRISASRQGLSTVVRAVTLAPGANLTQNFTLGAQAIVLDAIVATGQGTQTTRERVTTAISEVDASQIQASNEQNVVTALAAKAPGVNVTSSSGDPGSGTYIRIRDAASIVGGTQPLFVVDGTPIDNSSNAVTGTTGGTAVSNRAVDINPNDVEQVEILKGAAATAIYGSRGANGVVLITTKRGRSGSTQATFGTSVGWDEVSQLPELQQQYGRGMSWLAVAGAQPTVAAINEIFDGTAGFTPVSSFEEFEQRYANNVFADNVSYGQRLGDDVPTFDHAGELYETGFRMENNLQVSGGSDRTTYFLSLGRSSVDGVIRGNADFNRNSVRLKGTHFLFDDLQVSGNVAFAQSRTDLVQQGSNTSGILLGALRTPPEFNNCLPASELKPGQPCYVNPETGLQRSYRVPNPGTINSSSGYDNPFFAAQAHENWSQVGRTMGNVGLDYTPVNWLRLNYVLGVDYYGDEQLQHLPNSSAGAPTGQLITANFTQLIIDSNLSATISGAVNDRLLGSLTLGQNLNHEEFSRNLLTTSNLFPGTQQADFGVTRTPNEFESTQRTDGYFATTELTFADQFTVNATGRLDGSSNFGGDGKRFFYPSVGASWVFSKLPAFDNMSWMDLGKLRASWGKAGRQPPLYSYSSGFGTGNFFDSYTNPNGFNSVYAGQTGIFTQGTLGNPDIAPEVKTEREIGVDLAFLNRRIGLGVTYYNNTTRDVILSVPVPTTTGFFAQTANGAEFDGSGLELSLDLVPVQARGLTWTVNTNFTTSETCVTKLPGAEEITLAGFTGSTVNLVAPGAAGTTGCNAFGVFYGDDWIRFGRGTLVDIVQYDANGNAIPGMTERNVDIDARYPDAEDGAIFIGTNGFPIQDLAPRVVGDPNPDWTASLRNSFQVGSNLRLSALLDIRRGGDVWNGTKGALMHWGTHEESLPFQGLGTRRTFGEFAFPNGVTPEVGGPGVGTEVGLTYFNWMSGLGGGFNGPFSQYLEDGSFVKLRDVSVSYSFDQVGFLQRFGIASADVTVSGRNLKTWTDYTGIDPESNLTGATAARGLDYFNNPQTRSYVISVNLNR